MRKVANLHFTFKEDFMQIAKFGLKSDSFSIVIQRNNLNYSENYKYLGFFNVLK